MTPRWPSEAALVTILPGISVNNDGGSYTPPGNRRVYEPLGNMGPVRAVDSAEKFLSKCPLRLLRKVA